MRPVTIDAMDPQPLEQAATASVTKISQDFDHVNQLIKRNL